MFSPNTINPFALILLGFITFMLFMTARGLVKWVIEGKELRAYHAGQARRDHIADRIAAKSVANAAKSVAERDAKPKTVPATPKPKTAPVRTAKPKTAPVSAQTPKISARQQANAKWSPWDAGL